MKQTIAKVLLGTLIVFFGGCGGSAGSNATQIGRARIVANENLKLNKQIADKNMQIKDLENKIADMEEENAKIQEDCGNTNFRVLQIVAESEKRVEELTAENQMLKEELEKLKQ